jgi:DeoR/GlpR family transcriptional regulator of sugar metabolism
MLPRQRKRKIIEMVTERNGQSVDELATDLEVSEATIRRDLRQLAEEGLVERSHGGAVPVKSVGNERPYGQREVQYLEEKQAIASVATEEIRHGEVVFFDSGTTTMEVAKKAPADDSFVAITNSPLIALELRKQDGDVQLTGGSLRQRTRALVGPTAERFMQSSNFDVAFVGTNGIDADGVLTTPKAEEARMKELMIERSKRVVLVSTKEKLGEQSFKQFGTLDDVNVFVTDQPLSDEQRQWFDDANVRVVDGVAN